MRICETKSDLRDLRAGLAARGLTVGLVPTMGYLHDGHLALVRHAAERADAVIVSIFVNPTQFGPAEDLARYPRDTERDLALLSAEGVTAVFMPGAGEMYHPDTETIVETTALAGTLIGALRPGHFRGVATVVAKLLNLARPDIAVFGRKDYQQLCVIRTMVRDLDIPVAIEGVATMREPDGLAMSSRNVRLTPDHRAAAPALHAALTDAEADLGRGESVEETRRRIAARLSATGGADVRSVDIRDAETLAPVTGRPSRAAVILLAVRFGDVLLIDNRVIEPEDTP